MKKYTKGQIISIRLPYTSQKEEFVVSTNFEGDPKENIDKLIKVFRTESI